MNCYFAIIALNDEPIYEASFYKPAFADRLRQSDQLSLPSFVVHAAMDVIRLKRRATNMPFLAAVDRHQDWIVSAFVAGTGDCLIVMQEGGRQGEEGVRMFLEQVHELYIKSIMNPFYRMGDRLTSTAFEVKVRHLGKKYLEK